MDWQAMAAPWLRAEAETDAAHAPILDRLMTRAGLTPGQSVLDIGPGAGVSLLRAAKAVEPNGRVTGIEIAPPFAERARARVPGHVQVIVADAATHSYDPAGYDAAISMLGVMFFANPEQAFANIRTALKPGAALTFACWGPPKANPWFSMTGRIASEVLGTKAAFDPDSPGPMSLADPDKITRILTEAGWQSEIETQHLHLTPVGTPEEVANLHMTIGGAAHAMRLAKEADILTQTHKDAVRAGLVAGFAALQDGGQVRVPARVHLVRATA